MEESGISTISEKEVNGTMMNMNNNKNRKIFVAVIAVILVLSMIVPVGAAALMI